MSRPQNQRCNSPNVRGASGIGSTPCRMTQPPSHHRQIAPRPVFQSRMIVSSPAANVHRSRSCLSDTRAGSFSVADQEKATAFRHKLRLVVSLTVGMPAALPPCLPGNAADSAVNLAPSMESGSNRSTARFPRVTQTCPWITGSFSGWNRNSNSAFFSTSMSSATIKMLGFRNSRCRINRFKPRPGG